MEFSSLKFELLGESRAKDWIHVTWKGQKPENGIRFQVKTSMGAGKIIAKP